MLSVSTDSTALSTAMAAAYWPPGGLGLLEEVPPEYREPTTLAEVAAVFGFGVGYFTLHRLVDHGTYDKSKPYAITHDCIPEEICDRHVPALLHVIRNGWDYISPALVRRDGCYVEVGQLKVREGTYWEFLWHPEAGPA